MKLVELKNISASWMRRDYSVNGELATFRVVPVFRMSPPQSQ
jgi:hypothetical protein